MKTTLLLPVLNEIEGMKVILPKIHPGWCDQFLVVDGGSTDGSVEFAKQAGYEVYIQKEKGIRHAYNEVWPLIRGEVVVTFSPDGNCLPEMIPQLIQKVQAGYDMVIASRYLGGLRSEDDDVLTSFGNWMFTRLINTLHGGHYTDAMGIFRAYRRQLFVDLNLGAHAAYQPENWLQTVVGIEPLLSIRAARKKIRITEIAAPEPGRIGGERKLQPFKWGFVYLMQTLAESFSS